MADFTWTLQGSTPTTIEATDIIQFAGLGGFNTPIQVGEYNETTHVKSSGGTEDSSGNTPNNNKFISQAGGSGGDSEVDIGAGAVDLDTLGNGDAALKINFSDASSVETQNAIVYSYNGSDPATPAVGVDVRLAEIGDANWTEAESNANPLALSDQGAATSHDFYVAASVSPTTAGAKSGKLRIELTYF